MQIELKITVSDTEGKPSINIECDEKTNLNIMIAILEGTHKKILEHIDIYFAKNKVLTKSAMKEIYKNLKFKDLKI